eukprot:s79_g32.t1
MRGQREHRGTAPVSCFGCLLEVVQLPEFLCRDENDALVMAAYLIIALLGAHAALGDDSIRGEAAAPLTLKELEFQAEAASEAENAWNKTMQHTYHTYIPSNYQKLPSKAADIRASSAASSDEQKFTGYSSQYGGLAKVAMRGAKNDFHQRSGTSNGAIPDIPEMHEYADRYSSKQSSHADYRSYMKDYAGNEKGQDGEKYMKASGSTGSIDSSVPDKGDRKKPYQKYMRGGSSSWDEQYGHSSGWKTQLSGVVPSFVPRFVAEPGDQALGSARAEGVDATQLPSSQDSWALKVSPRLQDGLQQWYWLATASLTGLALVAGVQLGRRRRRTVHPPENLLG